MQPKKRTVRIFPFVVVLLTIGAVMAAWLVLRQQPAKAQSAANNGEVMQITAVDSIQASGTIAPLQSADVYWKTTGTVAEVKVKENDQIKAGDLLMVLDAASVPGNVASAQVDLTNARKNLSDLSTNADTAKVQALQSITNYAKSARDAQYQLENYSVPAEQATLAPMEAMDQMKKKLDKAWADFEPYMYHPESDKTRQDLKDALDQAQSDFDSAVKRVQYVYNLEVAETNLAKARQDYEKWKKGPDPDDLAATQARIAAAEATLHQLQITAPFDGEVLVVNYQPGDVVLSNLAAVSMANRSQLYVEVKVDESDFSKVKVGSPATVTLDALPGIELTGKVTFVNPLGAVEQGIVKYIVHVALVSADKGVIIPLGATANVTIQNGEPQQVLAVPISAIQNDAQGEYVNRINPDGTTQRVNITSGNIVGDLVVVAGNLQAGDQVVLGQAANSTSGPRGGMFGGR
jgi:HlyD family secretion protein